MWLKNSFDIQVKVLLVPCWWPLRELVPVKSSSGIGRQIWPCRWPVYSLSVSNYTWQICSTPPPLPVRLSSGSSHALILEDPPVLIFLRTITTFAWRPSGPFLGPGAAGLVLELFKTALTADNGRRSPPPKGRRWNSCREREWSSFTSVRCHSRWSWLLATLRRTAHSLWLLRVLEATGIICPSFPSLSFSARFAWCFEFLYLSVCLLKLAHSKMFILGPV